MGSGIRKMSDIGDKYLLLLLTKVFPILDKKRIIFLKKRYFMSVKIKDAILISNVTSELKLPVGNAGDETQPLALTVGQIKDFTLTGLSNVATTGSYNDLTNKPDLNIYATLSTLNSNYYNKTEIDSLITGGEGAGFLKMEFVDKLPPEGKADTFYFVKSEFPQEQNIYNEYVWDDKSKSYETVSKTDYITEKKVGEMIPAVYDSQITIQQGDTVKGTFTLNQSVNKTITLDAVTQSDWNQTNSTALDFIKNKPTVPSNTRSLLVTYDDGTQETIKVYTA